MENPQKMTKSCLLRAVGKLLVKMDIIFEKYIVLAKTYCFGKFKGVPQICYGRKLDFRDQRPKKPIAYYSRANLVVAGKNTDETVF